MTELHSPPRTCPVCAAQLALTRLSCDTCHTELSGHFQPCEFCALSLEDRALLRVFLASRGNIKEVERHLGVSYPTARARVDGLLSRMGVETASVAAPPRLELMERVARGEVSVDDAVAELEKA
jgi:hypothetical protein